MLKIVPTLKAEVEAKIKKLEAVYAERGHNWDDWDGLTYEEMEVFKIDPRRLARMVIAWDFFTGFLDLQVPSGYDEDLLQQERKRLPDIFKGGVALENFMAFAKEVGLTKREAHAAFAKMEWQQARSGDLCYNDESDDGSHWKQ